jgi:hypothetical protein
MNGIHGKSSRVSMFAAVLLSASAASAASSEDTAPAENPQESRAEVMDLASVRAIMINIERALVSDSIFRAELFNDPRQVLADRGLSRELQEGLLSEKNRLYKTGLDGALADCANTSCGNTVACGGTGCGITAGCGATNVCGLTNGCTVTNNCTITNLCVTGVCKVV